MQQSRYYAGPGFMAWDAKWHAADHVPTYLPWDAALHDALYVA